jgi:hypothetical protein
MHLRFQIGSLEDAQRAASVCQNIVLAFGGDPLVPAPRATRTERTETAAATGTVPTEPQPEPTTDPAFNREEVESYVKAGAVERGIVWVRENVFKRYNVKKPSELTYAQLVELAAKMRESEAV